MSATRDLLDTRDMLRDLLRACLFQLSPDLVAADKFDAIQPALVDMIVARSRQEKIDKEAQRQLEAQGLSQCAICTMPVLSTSDPQFAAKAEAIQQIAELGRSFRRCSCGGH